MAIKVNFRPFYKEMMKKYPQLKAAHQQAVEEHLKSLDKLGKPSEWEEGVRHFLGEV